MSEELTKLQQENIAQAAKVVSKLYRNERIVNYDLDLSKWTFKKLYGNTLWVKMLDEPNADTVLKNNIYVPVSSTKSPYRLGQVLMAGKDVKEALEGEFIQYPYGLGQLYTKCVDGYKTILIRESDVVAVVQHDGDVQTAIEEIKETILIN